MAAGDEARSRAIRPEEISWKFCYRETQYCRAREASKVRKHFQLDHQLALSCVSTDRRAVLHRQKHSCYVLGLISTGSNLHTPVETGLPAGACLHRQGLSSSKNSRSLPS